jgi:ligand-binding sensor domain-containing protein
VLSWDQWLHASRGRSDTAGLAASEQLAKEPVSVDWNYTARSWQAQNGLLGETVQSFAQTPDGLLWIGTSEGLFRFDGANFTLFSHENTPAMRENSVFCLLAGRDGHLWIGTDGGGLVEMRDGVFKAYTPSDGLTDGFVRALFEDRDGALWVATDSGLFRVIAGKAARIDNPGCCRASALGSPAASGLAPADCMRSTKGKRSHAHSAVTTINTV